MEWIVNDYVYGAKGFKYTDKLAFFDLDGTLISTKSGKIYPIDQNDWQFYSTHIITKLHQLYEDGYCITIITNQSKLTTNDKIAIWRNKLDSIIEKINLPIQLFCSISYDKYRKPAPGFMFLHINPTIKELGLIIKKSFYCGDACGRVNDHNNTDYKFALNVGLKFITPDEFFDDKKVIIPKLKYPPFDQMESLNLLHNNYEFIPYEKEMILMVGMPGSGKTTYVNNILIPLGYKRINKDTLLTTAKCVKETIKYLVAGKSIVIDNINHDTKTRNIYITLAQKYNYKVRSIIIRVEMELAKHNAIYRNYKGISKYIPEIVYKMYHKNYIEPSIKEGINEIINIYPKINITDDYKLYMY